jgi:hypothetical protein
MKKVDRYRLRRMILDGKDISQVEYSDIDDMSYLFYNCIHLKNVPEMNMSKVVRAREMFHNCRNLETINPWNFPDYNWEETNSEKLKQNYPELFI